MQILKGLWQGRGQGSGPGGAAGCEVSTLSFMDLSFVKFAACYHERLLAYGGQIFQKLQRQSILRINGKPQNQIDNFKNILSQVTVGGWLMSCPVDDLHRDVNERTDGGRFGE